MLCPLRRPWVGTGSTEKKGEGWGDGSAPEEHLPLLLRTQVQQCTAGTPAPEDPKILWAPDPHAHIAHVQIHAPTHDEE